MVLNTQKKILLTTSSEIMEKDINIAVKKGKIKYRFAKEFYILNYTSENSYLYFATSKYLSQK
jgi:hypothetical protein